MTENTTGAADVPFIVHESDMTRAERTNKRLMKATAAAFAALIVTNAAWIVSRRK